DDRAQSISSAVEELSTSVGSITEHSQEARQEADQVADSADAGVKAADQAAETMDGLVASVEQASGQVSKLSEASQQIGEIVQQIQDIAEKTNLLALNATIEAARAGEAGKGFAVVADEVKSLANQTQKATETIRGRIETLQGEITNIVGAMEDSGRRVREGQEVVASTGQEMKQVASRVDAVKQRLHHVAAILEQQTGASNEIAGSISTIADMSNRNLSVIESAISQLEASEQEIVAGIEDVLTRAPAYATIQAAKSDHMIWMRKLAQMLAGRARLNEAELADHHACRLGRWYDAQTDETLTRHPAWQALKAPHERVHACGIEATRRYNAGDLDGAAEKVREAGEASQEVMTQLDRLAADFT
ncbi:methyl-accepting chemotaxis sensory transducer, partial [Limimonas halophila]